MKTGAIASTAERFDMSEPREFWITIEDETENGKSSGYCYSENWINPESSIHVIEKSAYDKLAEENKRLRDALKFYALAENIYHSPIGLTEGKNGYPLGTIARKASEETK